MKIKYRLYWFGRNLIAFLLFLIATPFSIIWSIILAIRILFITNGSEVIGFPWEWNWRNF